MSGNKQTFRPVGSLWPTGRVLFYPVAIFSLSDTLISMFAVIKTGGKQYLVGPGQKLKIEKLEAKEGGSIVFDVVLLIGNEKKVIIGEPHLNGAKVEAKVLRHARTRKVIVFKYHAKTRYRKKKGHRQHFTEVEIGKITS